MKIHILLCDTFPGLLPADIPSYTSMFVDLFHRVDATIVFEEHRAFDGILPEVLSHDDLYLITGCNSAAYDDTPWIVNLRRWIVLAYNEGVRMAGICFGHQAIALALGGLVERYAGGWGTGIRASDIIDTTLKAFFSRHACAADNVQMHLLYNHHDQVMRLPEGAQPLATSAFCRYEGFRIGNRVVTFQGHPEYTPAYALHLLRHHAEGEDPAVVQRAIESIHVMQHEGDNAARFILDTCTVKD